MIPEQAQDVKLELLGCMDSADVSEHLKDAAATIAALQWQYGVEQDNPMCNHIEHGADPTRCRTIAWAPDEDTARSHAAMRFRADRHPRVVRRLTGNPEVVE